MSVYIRVMADGDMKEYLFSAGKLKNDDNPEKIIDLYSTLLNNRQATRYMMVRSSDDVIVGSFELNFCCNGACEICDVLVYGKYRRCGYAFSALIEIEQLVRKNGIDFLFLRVEQSNIPALNLYCKAGFQIYRVGEINNETYIMQKWIKQQDVFQHGRAQALVVRGNKILMVKHSVDGEEYWVLPGGGREQNETPEYGVLRELKEECGVSGTIIRKTAEFIDPYDDNTCFWTYLIDISDAEPTLGFDPEFSENEQVLREVAWKALDELSERDRVWLWSAGLISVPQFCDELDTWSREVIPASKK